MANYKITNKSVFSTLPRTVRGQSIVLGGDPKGKNFLYANGKNVIIRDVENPAIADIYTQHSHPVNVAKYSPSGFYIASGDQGGKIRIWDTTNKEHILKSEFQPLGGAIKDIAWDGESKRVAVAGEGREKYAHVFTYDSGNTVGDLVGHSKACNSVDIKPNRPFRLALASEDFTVTFFAGPPFKFKSSYQGHSNFVNCIRYAPDGSVFISGGADKRACIFDGITGEHIGELGDPAHKGGIYALSFSPDSKQLITASGDKTVKLWDVETRTAVTTFEMGGDIRDQQYGCLWMGDYLLSVSNSGFINYLDKNNPSKPLRIIKGHNKPATAMACTKDGSTTFTGETEARIYCWDSQTGDSDELQGKCHGSKIQDFAISDDNELISISMDDTIKFNSIQTRQYGDSVKLDSQPRAVQHSNGMTVVACIQHVVVFDHGQKKFAHSINYEAVSLSISNNGILAVGGEDKKVHLYSVSSGGLSEIQVIHNKDVPLDVGFSPDGAYLATAGADRYVRLYDMANYEMKFDGCPHTARATTLAWSPDSRCFATASLDNSICVWDPSKKSSYKHFKGAHPLATINKLMWLNNNILQSCADDSCIKQWIIESES